MSTIKRMEISEFLRNVNSGPVYLTPTSSKPSSFGNIGPKNSPSSSVFSLPSKNSNAVINSTDEMTFLSNSEYHNTPSSSTMTVDLKRSKSYKNSFKALGPPTPPDNKFVVDSIKNENTVLWELTRRFESTITALEDTNKKLEDTNFILFSRLLEGIARFKDDKTALLEENLSKGMQIAIMGDQLETLMAQNAKLKTYFRKVNSSSTSHKVRHSTPRARKSMPLPLILNKTK